MSQRNDSKMDRVDQEMIRKSFQLAKDARQSGNRPFGALLYDPQTDQIVEQAVNTIHTDCDCTGHAELNLCSALSKCYADKPEILQRSTLYTSTEPCPMCAGAIFWAGIGRVVFGCSVSKLNEMQDKTKGVLGMNIECRQLLSQGRGRQVDVVGPLLEDEAVRVHEGYWGSEELRGHVQQMLERHKSAK